MSLSHQNFAISTFPIIHFVCMFLAPQPRKQFCIALSSSSMQNCLRVLGSKKHADKVHYGKCGNNELQFLNPKRKICGFKNIPIRVDGALVLFSMKVRDFGTQIWPQYTSLWFVLKTCKQRT